MSGAASASMFRELFETAPDAMIVVDRAGGIVRVNAQAERLFGFAESELRGRPIETLLPERVRGAHAAHRQDYMRQPRVRPMGTGQELIGCKRDGQEFPVEIALSPLDTPDGPMVLASIRDISETQRARQALRHARYDAALGEIGRLALAAPNPGALAAAIPERIAASLDADAVAVLFRDPQLPRLHVRGASGVAADALEGMPWVPWLAPEPGDTPARVRAWLDREEFLPAGFRTCVSVGLYDRRELAGALVVLCRETRDFDRAARHFLEAVANLLDAALARIRAEEELSHSQRLEALGQLTGGIAHDFNNLLTVVSGNLQVLEDEIGDRPAAREIIASALRAVGRGAELTRKLLAFARRQRLTPRALAPDRLLAELAAMLRRTLGEGVEIAVDCKANLGPVFADPGQLDAALVNLALNARDAMPRGGRLTLSARAERIDAAQAGDALPAGAYVVFTVQDTGLGMTAEVLARALEPFFTTKEHGKGSGLGLSMVYGFAKQSGGHLTIDSRLGYGTRVDLFLPVAPEARADERKAAAPGTTRGDETILIVEDEADVRAIAVRFLQSLGYRVLAAADAAAALAQLEATPGIALLFSDVILGAGMSGVELADAARRLRPQLPVLLTSGYERAAADDARGFPLLHKPYRREQLAAAIRDAFARR